MKNFGLKPDEKQLSELAGSRKARVHRPGEKFVYRVPVDWIAAATMLPGKCVSTGLAIWFLSGVTKKLTVKLTRTTLRKFGVNKDSGWRAVHQLETAGLITVERGPGRSPIVTLVESLVDNSE